MSAWLSYASAGLLGKLQVLLACVGAVAVLLLLFRWLFRARGPFNR